MVGKILTKNREDIHCDFKMDKKSKYFIFVAPASLFFKIFPKNAFYTFFETEKY